MRRFLLMCLMLVGVLSSSLAEAQRPKNRPPLSVFFSAEAATNRLLGAAGPDSSWSFGGHLRQGLIFGPMVGWVRVGGDAWLTYQEGPPLQRGLRAFSTGLGLGAQHTAGLFRVMGFGEYVIVNLGGNPLHDSLGRRTMFHTLGGGGAIAFSGLSPFYVETRVAAHHWLATERPTTSLQIVLSIGIEARIRR